jgi:O-methyltransferase
MTAGSPESAMHVADAKAHLAAAPEARAAGPGADAQTLRSAYLDLLKLCLCDLAGAGTTSVGAMADGTVMSRELRGEALRLRAAGMDWPLHGLTMVGLRRLVDLQQCVESVARDGVEGDLIETGAWRGGASLLMRATLDTLGDQRTVWVADSFQGFPEGDAADPDAARLGAFDFLAVPLDEVRETFARFGCDAGVEFVAGFFEETLPALAGRRWALIRLDGDSYEATVHSLRCLYPGLSVGGYLVVDDYGRFDGCRQAVDEFRREHGIAEPIEKVDHVCVRWRRESDADIPAVEPRPQGSAALRAPDRTHDAPVPTAHEVELRGELATLRDRLAAVEAEVGLRAWLRRRLAR